MGHYEKDDRWFIHEKKLSANICLKLTSCGNLSVSDEKTNA